jgi:short-subunit dehydrogenase
MRVLITGCSTGVGRAIAVELQCRGHHVIATARDPRTLEDIDVSERRRLDVTNADSVIEVAHTVGPVDVLVNNAGRLHVGPVEHLDVDEVREVFEVNVFGMLRVTQAFLPAMRARRSGKIIMISSSAAALPRPLTSCYAASKRAVEAFSEALRFEVGHLGIDVVVISPGRVVSSFKANSVATPGIADDYAPIMARWNRMMADFALEDVPPEKAVGPIADIVEVDRPRFHYELGPGIEDRIAQRHAMGHAGYEARIRTEFDIPLSEFPGEIRPLDRRARDRRSDE